MGAVATIRLAPAHPVPKRAPAPDGAPVCAGTLLMGAVATIRLAPAHPVPKRAHTPAPPLSGFQGGSSFCSYSGGSGSPTSGSRHIHSSQKDLHDTFMWSLKVATLQL